MVVKKVTREKKIATKPQKTQRIQGFFLFFDAKKNTWIQKVMVF